jgi:hypothetical protein
MCLHVCTSFHVCANKYGLAPTAVRVIDFTARG